MTCILILLLILSFFEPANSPTPTHTPTPTPTPTSTEDDRILSLAGATETSSPLSSSELTPGTSMTCGSSTNWTRAWVGLPRLDAGEPSRGVTIFTPASKG